jgi:hypothetical protein
MIHNIGGAISKILIASIDKFHAALSQSRPAEGSKKNVCIKKVAWLAATAA